MQQTEQAFERIRHLVLTGQITDQAAAMAIGQIAMGTCTSDPSRRKHTYAVGVDEAAPGGDECVGYIGIVSKADPTDVEVVRVKYVAPRVGQLPAPKGAGLNAGCE